MSTSGPPPEPAGSGPAARRLRFLAIVLTALALVPGGAHLAELPAKMALDRDAYFVVQQIYAGWSLFGIVLFGALAATLALATLLHRRGQSCRLVLAACLLIGTNLAIFFTWTCPANRATANWTEIPVDWAALRLQWEMSHAAAAVAMLAAFLCLLADALRPPPKI